MSFHFKIRSDLLTEVRQDLARPHKHAWERVGFLRVGLAHGDKETLLLATEYQPVADEDYVVDPSVGAMISRDAIRKALEWADVWHGGVCHIHAHIGRGTPRFSTDDIRGNDRVIPSFFNIAPGKIHGAVVLSDNRMAGAVWTHKTATPAEIGRWTIVGAPLRVWRST